MKRYLCILIAIQACSLASAQQVVCRHDTIFVNALPWALVQQNHEGQFRFNIYGLNGAHLIEVHNGYVDIGDLPGMVVTFLNDERQAMITRDADFLQSLARLLVTSNLIDNGAAINARAESLFVNAFPLPDGYTDVEQLLDGQPMQRQLKRTR